MLASHIFRPRTFIRSRKAAVDSAFVSLLYRGRVSVDYGVFYMAVSCIFVASFHYCFYLRSAYLVINIVDLHLCWWPSILYRHCGALLVYRWVSV